MKVREVMSTSVVTVGPETAFVDVVEVLLGNEISGVPVVDGDGHLLGLVTEADLVSKEAYGHRRRRPLGLMFDYLRGRDPQWVRKGAARTAQDLMTADPLTVGPEDDVVTAARELLEGHVKRLPVVDDDGRLVGIVSRRNLLALFCRSDEDLAAEVAAVLADPTRVPETHEVTAAVADGVVTLTGTVLWPSDIPLVEAMVGRVTGVVGVENQLAAREPDPTVVHPWTPL